MGADAILAVCDFDGIARDQIRHLALTHAHGDHGGGAAHLKDRLPHLLVHATPRTAEIVGSGDEAAVTAVGASRRDLPRRLRLPPARSTTCTARTCRCGSAISR